MQKSTYSAGIAVDALESTTVEFILSDEIEDIIHLDDTATMRLHMLVRTCGRYR